jgi:hypothetical protein
MDPLTLATAATALLSPYIVKFAEKGAEKLGEALPDGIGKLWTAIGDKFKGKPAAEEAAKDLAAKPDDADNQAAFRKELKKTLTDDEPFLAELTKLLQAAQQTHIQYGDAFLGDHNFKIGNNYGTVIVGDGNSTTETTGAKVTNSQVGGDVTGHDKLTSGE